MKNVLDYVLNSKKLMTVKELVEKLDASQSTIYAMARGEKPIPEKVQESLSQIFNIRKEMWGKDLIRPAFADFILEDSSSLNALEREIVEYAKNASEPENYSRVGVQPAGNEIAQKNLPVSIDERVPESKIMPFIESDLKKDYLQKLSSGKGFYVWGVRSRVYNQWVKLSPGDFIMFARQGRFFLWGTVALTLHSSELARTIWGDEDELFEYIYLLSDVNEINIDVKEYNKLLEYSLNNRVQGFQVLDMDKSKKIIDAYGFDRKSFEIEDDGLEKQAGLDSSSNQKDCIEQNHFRSHLFGNRPTGECCICGRHLPVKGLTATYIKKRSECDLQEKQDVNVVVPMCRACDVWFEEGYITVNSSGYIDCIDDINSEKIATTDLLNELTKINGRKCFYWNQENKKYFEWHYNYHRMTT
ncbi:hypothetical protein [Bacillus rhizoplanae]|uniref:hypothetical protein n=1 Tax=Bacillus rhizoplanae TaxID=2880966 RepID=UPI003D19CCFA